ncbi:hypothetical protein AOLI_G00039870 [Acnodon oligacanthus]
MLKENVISRFDTMIFLRFRFLLFAAVVFTLLVSITVELSPISCQSCLKPCWSWNSLIWGGAVI